MTVRELVEKYIGKCKEVSAGNLQVFNCPFCGKKDGKFYIKEDTGVYICHHGSCGAKGNLSTLKEKLGLKDKDVKLGTKKKVMKEKLVYNRSNIGTLLNNYKQEQEDAKPTIEFINGRGIDTIVAFDNSVQYQKSDNAVMFVYKENGQLAGIKYRSIKEKKFYQAAGSKAVLWNMDNATNEKLLICEGEWDMLTLAQCGYKDMATSVPMGVGNLDWIDNCRELLESKKEIILIFDNDDAGKIALNKVSQRLEYLDAEIKTVDLGSYKDLNEVLMFEGVQKVRDMVENPLNIEIKGIETLYETERFDINDLERVPYGIESVDNVLRGAKEGELIILAGSNGSGKTTITKQFMLNARSFGKKVFVVNGEIDNKIFKEDLFLQANGDNPLVKVEDRMFPGNYDYKVTDENYTKINAWLDGYFYSMSSSESLTDENVMNKIKLAIKKHNCFFIVVDNLSVIDCKGENESSAKGEFAAKLKALAVQYGVCVLLVNHLIKGERTGRGQEAIKGGGKVTDVADVVLILDRIDDVSADHNAILGIKKNRLKGKIADINLYFSGRHKTLNDKREFKNNYKWKEYNEEIELDDLPW